MGVVDRRVVEARRLLANDADAEFDAILLQRHLHADESGCEDEKENSGKIWTFPIILHEVKWAKLKCDK